MDLGSWLWWLLYWFLLVIALMIIFRVVSDLFRRDDLGGWGKAGWLLFILVLPWLALFVYVVSQGNRMQSRDAQAVAQARSDTDDYIRSVAAAGDPTAQIARAHELLAAGAISKEEFDALKARALA